MLHVQVETLLAEPGILTTRQEQIAFAPYCTNFIIIVVQFEKRRNRKYHFWLDRPIVWSPRLKYLWVNVVIQPGGFLQASVLRNLTSADVVDAATSSRITSQGENDSFVPFERLRLNTSSVGGMTANTCVDPAAGVRDQPSQNPISFVHLSFAALKGLIVSNACARCLTAHALPCAGKVYLILDQYQARW